jgi:hypothetical protein
MRSDRARGEVVSAFAAAQRRTGLKVLITP